MAKFTVMSISLIIYLVVMNQQRSFINSVVLASANELIEAGRAGVKSQQQQQQQQLQGSDGQAPDQIKMNGLISLERDDHSNIELDKLLDANRYQVLMPTENPFWQQQQQQRDYNLASKLFSSILNLNSKSRDYLKNQMERKRSLRDRSLSEDKDYSFVALQPQTVSPFSRLYYPSTTNQQQQQQQQRAAKWAAQKLHDMRQR